MHFGNLGLVIDLNQADTLQVDKELVREGRAAIIGGFFLLA